MYQDDKEALIKIVIVYAVMIAALLFIAGCSVRVPFDLSRDNTGCRKPNICKH